MGDKRGGDEGVAGTEKNVTEEMLDS